MNTDFRDGPAVGSRNRSKRSIAKKWGDVEIPEKIRNPPFWLKVH